jgi:selenocysteine lyase/cysteine desulfurase
MEVTTIPQTLSLVGPQAPQNVASLRAQVPVLTERVNGRRLTYLDSAATTQ